MMKGSKQILALGLTVEQLQWKAFLQETDFKKYR